MNRAGGWLWGAILLSLLGSAQADDWPQWRGPQRDGVWRETGITETLPQPQIPIRWRAPVSGGYSGPTVAAGRVFVTDRVEAPQEQERIHCFDAADGHVLWTQSYPCEYGNLSYGVGPRASVTVHDGRAYALGSMGHFLCLDAVTGEVLWRKQLVDDFQLRRPLWGMSAAPLVEGDLVIVSGGEGQGTCLLAFDRRSGSLRWKALDEEASYSSPIIIHQAGQRVLVSWTGTRLVGVDPTSGKLHWEVPFRHERDVEAIATPVVDGGRLFVSCIQDGSLMVRLNQEKLAVEEVWRRHGKDERHTDSVQSLICTPFLKGECVYAVDAYGPLLCLNAANGDRLWKNTTATSQVRWGTLHMVQNGDKTWMFNDRGELLVGRLSPEGFQELSRAQLLRPTTGQLPRKEGVCWSHPAFANRHIFVRNDEELVCANLAAEAQ